MNKSWKKKHTTNGCGRAKCGICKVHKKHPKTGKFFTAKQKAELFLRKIILKEYENL